MKKIGKRLISVVIMIFMLVQAFYLTVWAGDNTSYQNGSTKEYVYSTVASCKAQGGDYIGYLYPYEKADVCGYYNGCYIIFYFTDSKDVKVGFVKYNGGNKSPYWHPKSFKNGNSKLLIYRSIKNASDRVNSIGYLFPNEECKLVTKYVDAYGWLYYILLYSAGSTTKVGFARMGRY